MKQLAKGKAVPAEVLEHIVRKTDGVPLFVEELTRTILTSSVVRETGASYELTGPLSKLSIPATLHESLMARLDRMPYIREVAQLGAVLGREFAYDVLHALKLVDDAVLDEGLSLLVADELLYQRGRAPRAKYIFKHALIQDAAYQSLLRRTRQHYHRQVALCIEQRSPEVAEQQPEAARVPLRRRGDGGAGGGLLAEGDQARARARGVCGSVRADRLRHGVARRRARFARAHAHGGEAAVAAGVCVLGDARHGVGPGRQGLCRGAGAVRTAWRSNA